MIKAHLYARHDQTAVYAVAGGSTKLLCHLYSGQWVGVLDQKEEWMYVVTTSCTGWVHAGDLESRPPFQLKALLTPDNKLDYRAQ